MPEPLEILIEGTPNPHAVKFTLNRTVATTGETYRLPAAPPGPAQAGGDPAGVAAPWAKALLGIPGVVGVYGVNNFISLNKKPEVEWDAIIPKAEAGLKQVYGP